MNKIKKNNIVAFPKNLSEGEREVEAIVFSAAEPLDIETIESKVSKKINVLKILEKLQNIYSNRGINFILFTSTNPLFVIRKLGITDKGSKLKPI